MGKKKKTHLPFRINVLFFIIFLLFAFLILQLGVVQILHGEQAQNEIDRTENTITNVPVPRGLMYDRYGRALITNEPIYSITYTPPKNVQSNDKIELAQKLAKYIEKPDDKITEWDIKDYWIVKNQEEAYGRLTEEEQELDNTEQYHAVIDKVTEEDLKELTDADREVVAILRELNQAPALTPHIVKNEGVSEKEYAIVAEHLSELDGINVAIDWNRNNEFGSTFTNFIGSITSYDEGLPAENIDYYLARNYSRNDRVGESGLEQQYETILKGQKKQIQNITDKDGDLVGTEIINEGEQGKSLVLTIDIDLQQKVDQIVEEELEKVIKAHPSTNQHLKDALVVMMDPNTGEILTMSGKRYYREGEDENNPEPHFKDESFRTIYDAHRPGSSVKGATVLAGYESGVINIGQSFYDAPIKIAGTPEKGSYSSLGYVDDLEALAKSSNVYMFYIAMRMGGEYNYIRNAQVNFDPDAFRQMRNYFKQFGLGVATGVDLPFESTGYQGDEAKPGLLMDYAIGQYDTFTALQLAQYVSTLANDGYRLRPHLVKEIWNPSSTDGPGSVAEVIQPEVLNKIEMEQNEIERVQEGFRRVFQHTDGTADHVFRNKDYKPAGKTGTAQNEVYKNIDGEVVKVADVENLTLVGYAPYDNPEVAFAVIVPNVGLKAGDSINYYIGERILDAYFDLKEQRSKEGIDIENTESTDSESDNNDENNNNEETE